MIKFPIFLYVMRARMRNRLVWSFPLSKPLIPLSVPIYLNMFILMCGFLLLCLLMVVIDISFHEKCLFFCKNKYHAFLSHAGVWGHIPATYFLACARRTVRSRAQWVVSWFLLPLFAGFDCFHSIWLFSPSVFCLLLWPPMSTCISTSLASLTTADETLWWYEICLSVCHKLSACLLITYPTVCLSLPTSPAWEGVLESYFLTLFLFCLLFYFIHLLFASWNFCCQVALVWRRVLEYIIRFEIYYTRSFRSI